MPPRADESAVSTINRLLRKSCVLCEAASLLNLFVINDKQRTLASLNQKGVIGAI
jgi:hypothetical protein